MIELPKISWQKDGKCVGHAALRPDDFFIEGKYARNGATYSAHVMALKAVCAGCPVKKECLSFAIENREKYGIWGGKTSAERKNMLRTPKQERGAA